MPPRRPALLRPVPLIWRTVILRILLGSIVVCLISSVVLCIQEFAGTPVTDWWEAVIILFLPLLLITLHHVLRLWPRRRWWAVAELLWSLVELGGVAFLCFLFVIEFVADADNGHEFILGVSWVVLGISVCLAFLFLLWDTIAHIRKNLRSPYDFSAKVGTGHSQWQFIFGSFTMRERFSAEKRPIRWFRGGVAIICLLALSFVAFYGLIAQPLRRGGQSVVKLSKVSIWRLGDRLNKLSSVEARVILDVSDLQRLQQDIPHSILNVTATLLPRFDNRTLRLSVCQDAPQPDSAYMGMSCPFDPEGSVKPRLSHIRNLEILVTIDFSLIPNVTQTPFRIGVYTGVTNSSEDTLANTKPLYIGPGSHLYGLSSISLKERSSNQGFAALGIPKYRPFPVINVDYLFPDWSPSIPGNNTSSLRFFIPSVDEVQVEQEYFENSVVDGFALVGGVWTFINGLFATIFGSTLLLVLFGIKPLSIYGLIHQFQKSSHIPRPLSTEDRGWVTEILSEYLLDDDIWAGRNPQPEGDPIEPDLPHDEKNGAEAERLMG